MRGTLFGGPYNKDCSILGSTLGSPYVGKLPFLLRLILTKPNVSATYVDAGVSKINCMDIER